MAALAAMVVEVMAAAMAAPEAATAEVTVQLMAAEAVVMARGAEGARLVVVVLVPGPEQAQAEQEQEQVAVRAPVQPEQAPRAPVLLRRVTLALMG